MMKYGHRILLVIIALIAVAIALSGCGTATMADFGGGIKEIKFEGFTQSPYQHEIRSQMEMLSMKECPNGYEILNQTQSNSPRRVVWKIKCN